MDERDVVFLGIRVNTWTDKDKKQQTRILADMYMAGVGSYDKVLTPEEHQALVRVAPGTAMKQQVRFEISNEIVKIGERQFATRKPSVRFGELVLAENARKAS